jgi:hypothetical protein
MSRLAEREYGCCSSFSSISITNAQITLALIHSFSKKSLKPKRKKNL